MKLCIIVVLLVLLVTLLAVVPALTATFTEDFNDGDMSGWLSSQNYAGSYGNWRVENEVMMQDQPGDGYIVLVDGLQFSTQSIETRLKLHDPAGYGGFIIWHQALDTLLAVRLYPAGGGVWIHEISNGIGDELVVYPYSSAYGTWYDLRVDADSVNKELKVYINDVYLFTHITSTDYRSGSSGLFGGNNGGYFDDFSLTNPVPEPSSLLVLGGGVVGLIGIRKRKE